LSEEAAASGSAAAPWFHLATIPGPGETVELEASESGHAARARRLRSGAAIVVFDGLVTTATAELIGSSARRLTARVSSRQSHTPERPAIHLACALPRGDRLSQLLGMATQLGMSSFTPLTWARSVVRPKPGSPERWQRLLREACKQSRRPHLPRLGEPRDALDYVAQLGDADPVLLLSPDGDPARAVLAQSDISNAHSLHLLVGPEGGLDDAEVRTLRGSAAKSVCLGRGILRIETAAVAALAILGTLRTTPPTP